ncbi:MAG: hypothetical protein ACFFDT_23185, partial [Candidatus Hodarchaeota archaeon]
MKRKISMIILTIIFLRIGFVTSVNSKIVSEQLTLTEIGNLHTGSRTVDVCVQGDILYALDLDVGLKIYNISDPTVPEKIGFFYETYTFSHGLYYSNKLIFI